MPLLPTERQMDRQTGGFGSECVRRLAGAACLAALLSACGGGGGGGDGFDTPGAGAPGNPAFTSITIASSGGDPAAAVPGDVISVRIEASEAILAPSVRIAGAAADSVTGSANSWVATRTMRIGDPDGPVAIAINIRDHSGLTGPAAAATTDGSQVVFANPVVYELVWEENFDGDSLDLQRWNIQLGDGTNEGLPAGWGNGELQLYEAGQVAVRDGRLVITAAEPSAGQYRSARINTRGKVDFVFNNSGTKTSPGEAAAGIRVEVRARLPQGQGIWPAIWMLPTDDEYGPWPQSGEIDIVEATNLGVGGKKSISSTLHFGFPWPDNTFTTAPYTPNDPPQDGFHNYMMEWEDGEIRFYFDGTHYATMTESNWFTVSRDAATHEFSEPAAPAPFDQYFHLLLNVAIGGGLPGAPDDTTQFPQTMEVDWIRVHACTGIYEELPCATPVDETVAPVNGPGNADIHPIITLYENGEIKPLTFTVRGAEYMNTPTVGQYQPDGASNIMMNDRMSADPAGTRGMVWRFQVAGGIGNTWIESQDFASHEVLNKGFDFRGADSGGRMVFDMYVASLANGTTLLAKMDSGHPNLGQVTVPDTVMNEWKTYSIPIKQFVQNPLSGGSGVNLANVGNPFVIEPANADPTMIDADIYLDNIRLIIACPGNVGCEPKQRAKPLTGEPSVFDDALDPTWGTFSAFDQALNYSSCVDDNGMGCPSISWNIVDAADPNRGKVIEVTYPDPAQFAGLVVGGPLAEGAERDLSAFANGHLAFDVLMTANPSAVNLRAKVDCTGCPTDGGQREQDLGAFVLNEWTEVSVSIAAMVAADGGPAAGGLRLNAVTTGLVIFAPFDNTSGVSYQLDNVRWVMGAPPVVVTGAGAVYGDEVDAQWTTSKIDAFDSQNGYMSGCADDGGAACPSLNYSEVDVTGRGKVLEVVYDTSAVHAGIVVGLASGGLDFSAFAGGTVKFDIRVTANPDTTANFRAKADCTGASGCGFASNAREQVIGMLPLNMWQEISINVDDMVNANGGPTAGDGLQLSGVTTGLVLFPEHSKASGVTFQLDNVRWETAP